MPIMCEGLEYYSWPTKVPFICVEHFYEPEKREIDRKYYHFTPRKWFALRKICHT